MVLLLMAVLTTPAAATSGKTAAKTPPGQAQFEGRQINLQRGWGDARTCVVWNEDGETDCFRTEQAADAAVERRARARARAVASHASWNGSWAGVGRLGSQTAQVQSASSCSSWLHLYEHVGYDGRSLRFRDLGVTQDLAAWGFAAQTSSYRVGACSATLRDAAGTVHPGWTGAYASASRMLSGWNDRVRYLRIR